MVLPEKIGGIALTGHPKGSFPSADTRDGLSDFCNSINSFLLHGCLLREPGVECGLGFSNKHELCGQRLQTGCPLASAGLQIKKNKQTLN